MAIIITKLLMLLDYLKVFTIKYKEKIFKLLINK